MLYIVYVRRYSGPVGHSKPIGRTSKLPKALSVCRDRNAHREPNEWYGVESQGQPVYRPDDVRMVPTVAGVVGQ